MKGERVFQILVNSLDLLPNKPIIGRNREAMNEIFNLSLIIVVLLAVLIIKDQFSVRMAAVRVKK
jgi:hypothetical protein